MWPTCLYSPLARRLRYSFFDFWYIFGWAVATNWWNTLEVLPIYIGPAIIPDLD